MTLNVEKSLSFQMLKKMATQVLSVQNGDDVLNIKHQYNDVYSLDIGSNSKFRMKYTSLIEILQCLYLWTDIVEGEKPKIYIHDYDLAEVGPEKYDVSQRTLFEEFKNMNTRLQIKSMQAQRKHVSHCLPQL